MYSPSLKENFKNYWVSSTKLCYTSFSNSLIVHKVKTKEIMANLILISIDFDDFTSLFSP